MNEDILNEKNEENNLNVNQSLDKKTFTRNQVIRKFISEMISFTPKSEMNSSDFSCNSLIDVEDVTISASSDHSADVEMQYTNDKKFMSYINNENMQMETLEDSSSYNLLEESYNVEERIPNSSEMFLSFYTNTSEAETEKQKNLQDKEKIHHENNIYNRNSVARVRRREKLRKIQETSSSSSVPTNCWNGMSTSNDDLTLPTWNGMLSSELMSNLLLNSNTNDFNLPLWDNVLSSYFFNTFYDSIYSASEDEDLAPLRTFFEEEEEIEEMIQNSLLSLNSRNNRFNPLRMETIVEETSSIETISRESSQKLTSNPSIIIESSNSMNFDAENNLSFPTDFMELEKYKTEKSNNSDSSSLTSHSIVLESEFDNELINPENNTATKSLNPNEFYIKINSDSENTTSRSQTPINDILEPGNENHNLELSPKTDINFLELNPKNSKVPILNLSDLQEKSLQNDQENVIDKEETNHFLKLSSSISKLPSSKVIECFECKSREEIKHSSQRKRGVKRKYSERLNSNLRPNIEIKSSHYNKSSKKEKTNSIKSDGYMISTSSRPNLKNSKSFPLTCKTDSRMNNCRQKSLEELKLNLTPSTSANVNKSLRKIFSKFRRKNLVHPYQPLVNASSHQNDAINGSKRQLKTSDRSKPELPLNKQIEEDLSIHLPNSCSPLPNSEVESQSPENKLEVLWPIEGEINIEESNSSSNGHHFITNYTARKLSSNHSLISENHTPTAVRNNFLSRLKLMRNTGDHLENEHMLRTYEWLHQEKTIHSESSECDLISSQDHCGLANPSISTKKIVSLPDVESFLMSIPTPGFEVQQSQKQLREYLKTSSRSSDETISSNEFLTFPITHRNNDTFVAKAVTLFDVRNNIRELKGPQNIKSIIRSDLHDDGWHRYRYITTPSDCNSLMTQTDRIEISNVSPSVKNKCLFLYKMKQTLSNFFLERKRYFE